YAAVVLHHDAQTTVMVHARGGSQTLHHFLLQHEVHVFDAVRLRQQVEHQRGGNVVGQVADHAQLLAPGGEVAEVELEGVALMQTEALKETELAHQYRVQVLIQLNHVELCTTGQQTRGNGALTGADL